MNTQQRSPAPRLIRRLLDPDKGLHVFCFALAFAYGIAPLAVYIFHPAGGSYLKLALITFCSIGAILIGSRFSLLDHRFREATSRLFIPDRWFNLTTWGIFLIFFAVTLATAPSIPILSAFQGASGSELSDERGAFLKGRQGAEIALLYVSTFLVNTIVPYSVVLLYLRRSKWRHISAFVFLLFCISFMQKSLFLNLTLPLLVFMAYSRQLGRRAFFAIAAGSIALLLVTTALSLRSEESSASGRGGDFLSAMYAPSGPVEYFFWRSVAVPVFTASDTLVVHAQRFQDRPLFGATSTFLSLVFNLERVNLERYVFEHQFGGWNEIANSNAVFSVEAYVNFDWIGVVIFGFFVGMVFRWFRLASDPAFKSLWILFAFVLFSAGLIGMLLSNGFAYMLFHALYFRVGEYGKRTR